MKKIKVPMAQKAMRRVLRLGHYWKNFEYFKITLGIAFCGGGYGMPA